MRHVTRICFIAGLALLALMLIAPAAMAQRGLPAQIAQSMKRVEQNPDSVSNRQMLVGLYNKEGNGHVQSGNFETALSSFRNGISVADDSNGALASSDQRVADALYGEAYSLIAQGAKVEGIIGLEGIIIDNPQNYDARLLLGVTALRSGGADNIAKGMDILKVMANEAEGDDQIRAGQAGIRFGYNLSTIDAALGDDQAALNLLSDSRSSFGSDAGATEAENNAIQYALGVYELGSGNATNAVAELAFLVDTNPGFMLSNGVTGKAVAAGAYYQAGVALLSKKDKKSGQKALDMFENAEQLDGEDTVDVHHGKALAYVSLQDQNNVARELKIIGELNPARLPEIAK